MRNIIRIAGVAGLALLIPILLTLLAIWHWKPGVYFLAFLLLVGGVSLTYRLLAKKMLSNKTYLSAVLIAIATVFILLWMNAAVEGILGDNPANMMYFGVLLVGTAGALMAQLESLGMSRAMFATAFAILLVPPIAWAIGTPNVANRLLPLIGLHAAFALMFVISAMLFRKAARGQSRAHMLFPSQTH